MRVGSIGYASDQGIGHLMKWFYDAGVITDVKIFYHSGRDRINHTEWYPEGTEVIAKRPFNWPGIQAWVRSMNAMLFFETPFDWGIIDYCRSVGVRTYIMPMYECTPKDIPCQPDKWVCPSALDLDYFKKFGNAEFIEVPVNQAKWQQRVTARRFLHNGGHLGLRGHKGTREIIKAMEYVASPAHLTVRSQDQHGLHKIIGEVRSRQYDPMSDPRIEFEFGEQPYSTLFDNHDVFIMAEKYNGLSLPLREAWSHGLVVMTSDRYPMNTWLPHGLLIPVSGYHKARISGAYMEYDEAVIDPRDIARTIDLWYGKEIVAQSLAGDVWAKQLSWKTMKPKWLEILSRK